MDKRRGAVAPERCLCARLRSRGDRHLPMPYASPDECNRCGRLELLVPCRRRLSMIREIGETPASVGRSQSGGRGSRIKCPVSAPPPTRHRVAATTSGRLRGRQMELASGAHIIAVSSLSCESLYCHHTTLTTLAR